MCFCKHADASAGEVHAMRDARVMGERGVAYRMPAVLPPGTGIL